jgi:hypothetical protein
MGPLAEQCPSKEGVMHIFVSTRGSLHGFLMELNCAPTVHESNVFILLGIALSEKQIPRFIGNVRS